MAKTVALTSGSGGAGKTTAAAFLGRALARLEKQVLIIETDAGFSELDILLNVSEKAVFDLSDILLNRCEITNVVIPCDDSKLLRLIAAPALAENAPDPQMLLKLTDELDKYFDYIIIDLPSGLSKLSYEICRRAQLTLVMCIPDPAGVRNTARLCREQADTAAMRLLVNRVNTELPASEIMDLDEIIDRTGIQLFGVIPESSEIANAAASGRDLQEGTSAAKVYDALAQRITGRHVYLVIE